jgi:hypothetical protein
VDSEIFFRRELEAAGEAQVRAEFYNRGALSTGGEDRNKIIREWLREQEKKRQTRDRLTFWFVLGAFVASVGGFVASVGGVIATILHR